jgi:hypothetical protein
MLLFTKQKRMAETVLCLVDQFGERIANLVTVGIHITFVFLRLLKNRSLRRFGGVSDLVLSVASGRKEVTLPREIITNSIFLLLFTALL